MSTALSPSVQTALQQPPLDNFPTNGTIELTEGVAEYMPREKVASFVYLDWDNINARRDEWTSKFDDVVRQ